VEDAVAAGDGRRQAAAVQQVGPEQPQPLAGAFQRRQVRVLGVACAQMESNRIDHRHIHVLALSMMFWRTRKNSIDSKLRSIIFIQGLN